MSGKTVAKMTTLIDGSAVWIDDTGKLFADFLGNEVELGDTTECLNDISVSALLKIVGITCSDAIETIDYTDILSGWTSITFNPVSVTPVAVSVDSLENILVVGDDGKVYNGTDNDFVEIGANTDFTINAKDISVTIEGSVWVILEDEDGNDTVG